jgi:hypothetical protein
MTINEYANNITKASNTINYVNFNSKKALLADSTTTNGIGNTLTEVIKGMTNCFCFAVHKSYKYAVITMYFNSNKSYKYVAVNCKTMECNEYDSIKEAKSYITSELAKPEPIVVPLTGHELNEQKKSDKADSAKNGKKE